MTDSRENTLVARRHPDYSEMYEHWCFLHWQALNNLSRLVLLQIMVTSSAMATVLLLFGFVLNVGFLLVMLVQRMALIRIMMAMIVVIIIWIGLVDALTRRMFKATIHVPRRTTNKL